MLHLNRKVTKEGKKAGIQQVPPVGGSKSSVVHLHGLLSLLREKCDLIALIDLTRLREMQRRVQGWPASGGYSRNFRRNFPLLRDLLAPDILPAGQLNTHSSEYAVALELATSGGVIERYLFDVKLCFLMVAM